MLTDSDYLVHNVENAKYFREINILMKLKPNMADCSTCQVFSSDGDYLFSFGDLGKGPGQFKGPHGLAIDSENNVYVADLYNHRIQVFTSTGKFLRTFGKEGRLPGELSEPRAIAFTPPPEPGTTG